MTVIDQSTWDQLRRSVRGAQTSCLHCAIGSVNPDGTPHVTPIGSVMLTEDPGRGVYHDAFNARLSRNLETNPNICLLAVDSHKPPWIRALIKGRFVDPPGVQLVGIAGPRRKATAEELERMQRRMKPLLRTKGGQHIWRHVESVRDLTFTSTRTIRIGTMTNLATPNEIPT